MSNEPQDFNDGHIIEGLDRCHTIMVMIDELLSGHPSVTKAVQEEEVTKAIKVIFDMYQKIGELDDDLST